MQPKILLYDIEVSRDVVEGYGNKWEFKVVKTLRHQEIMSFAWKWLGESKVHYLDRHDVEYHTLIQKLADLQDEADIVIAHNGNKFDNKMANRFFIKENVAPPSPYKGIDTLQIARSTFKFQSNSLNELSSYLDLGQKESITYADLEDNFMSDFPSKKTKKLMEKYNKQDVVLLEKVYLKLRPFIKNHPNLGDISQEDGVCPKCSSDLLTKRGFIMTRSGEKQRYVCDNCGGWCSEATVRRLGRKVNA